MSDQSTSPPRRGKRPPGPSGHPIIGSLLAFERGPYAFKTRLAREHGDVARYAVAGMDFYQLSGPAAIEHVLVHNNGNYVKGELFQETLGPVTGNGLLNSEGEFWRSQRRSVEPAFHPRLIASYADTMVGRTLETTETWADGSVVDVYEEMIDLTLDIVADTLFGVDVDRYVGTLGPALETVLTYQEGALVDLLPVDLPTPRQRRFEAAVDDLDRVVYGIVDERRRALESGEATSPDGAPSGGRDDVVSMLLAAEDDAGEPMPRRQVRDEVMTLLLAGHETSAIALALTTYALAKHPGVEERLRAELQDVLDGADPTVDDLDDLPYLDRVVTESLRLYPPVPGFLREAVEDDVVDGYRIPAGGTVSINQWTVHRDPRFYDDPLAFRPDRWTDGFRRSLPNLAYFPFSAGPRRCVGDRFATVEVKLVLATLISRYHLELVSPATLDLLATVTARPTDPIEMRVHRLDG